MSLLVKLSIDCEPDRMINFAAYLEEGEDGEPIIGVRPAWNPTAIQTSTFIAATHEAADALVAAWRDYFTRYHPRVRCSEPHITPLADSPEIPSPP